MPSAKNSSVKPDSALADATAKTRSLVEDLQARLTGETRAPTGPRTRTDIRPIEYGRLAPKTVDIVAVAGTEDDIHQFETEEDLERQLQAYFERTMPPVAPRAEIPDDLRSRVIEGVVDRVLSDWANPQGTTAVSASLRNEVIERLAERMLDQLQKIHDSTNTRKAGAS